MEKIEVKNRDCLKGSDVWLLGFREDLQYDEYETIDGMVKDENVVFGVWISQWKNPEYDYQYLFFILKKLDGWGVYSGYHMNGWWIGLKSDFRYFYRRKETKHKVLTEQTFVTNFVVESPNDATRQFDQIVDYSGNCIEQIRLVYRLLKYLGQFKSWVEFDEAGGYKPHRPIYSPNDKIFTDSNPSVESSEKVTLFAELNSFIGLDEVKNEVRDLTALVEARMLRIKNKLKVSPSTLHMVFSGSPGTGKTSVARIIGKIFKDLGLLKSGHVIETDYSGLVAEYVGQTTAKTKAIFQKALGGVLFIDEAYALVKDGGNTYGKESIETLLKLMEDHRDDIVVIVAGYPNEMKSLLESNPGLESRFPTKLNFNDFNSETKLQIFLDLCSKEEYTLTVEATDSARKYLSTCGMDEPKFANARGVRTLFEKCQKNQAKRIKKITAPTRDQLITFEGSDIPECPVE